MPFSGTVMSLVLAASNPSGQTAMDLGINTYAD